MQICLGTANIFNNYGLSHKNKIKKDYRFLSKINKSNIRYFDLSNGYRNTTKFYKIFNKNHNIIFKLSFKNKKITSKLLTKIEKQLISYKNKIKVKSFYAVLLHDSQEMYKKNKHLIFNFLKSLKNKNICKKIGISSYSENNLKLFKKYKFDIIQFPVNIFDQRILKKKNENLIKEKNIEVHVRSIFLQGLLIRSEFIDKKFKIFKEFKKLDRFVLNNGIDRLTACLYFIYKIKYVKLVVIGVDSLEKLVEIRKKIDFIKKNKIKISLNK
jgi:aryl-alcohol dehydrogenase-like predicted oxidoreductase